MNQVVVEKQDVAFDFGLLLSLEASALSAFLRRISACMLCKAFWRSCSITCFFQASNLALDWLDECFLQLFLTSLFTFLVFACLTDYCLLFGGLCDLSFCDGFLRIGLLTVGTAGTLR